MHVSPLRSVFFFFSFFLTLISKLLFSSFIGDFYFPLTRILSLSSSFIFLPLNLSEKGSSLFWYLFFLILVSDDCYFLHCFSKLVYSFPLFSSIFFFTLSFMFTFFSLCSSFSTIFQLFLSSFIIPIFSLIFHWYSFISLFSFIFYFFFTNFLSVFLVGVCLCPFLCVFSSLLSTSYRIYFFFYFVSLCS